MRVVWGVAILLVVAMPLQAQKPEPPPVRYEVVPQLASYPQSTPKEALATLIKLVEKEKFEYLAAHIIDYKFIDSKVRDRSKLYLDEIDANYRALRDVQRADPVRYPPGSRLPDDPQAFAAIVETAAKQKAFRFVAKDIRAIFAENPENLKDFRKFLREGNFSEAADTATVSHLQIKNKAVFFKKVGDYWTIEDRQTPDQDTPPKK